MNVKQIVIDYLKAHGCDGLCADGCRYGCDLNGLGECFCGITEVCQPAKFVDGELKPVEVPQEKETCKWKAFKTLHGYYNYRDCARIIRGTISKFCPECGKPIEVKGGGE